MIENLKLEDFARQLNTVFRATLPAGRFLEFTLIEAKPGRKSAVQETFSLVFRAPAVVRAESATFELEHSEMGSIAIFMSPFKSDAQGIYYEAAFNRLLAPGS